MKHAVETFETMLRVEVDGSARDKEIIIETSTATHSFAFLNATTFPHIKISPRLKVGDVRYIHITTLWTKQKRRPGPEWIKVLPNRDFYSGDLSWIQLNPRGKRHPVTHRVEKSEASGCPRAVAGFFGLPQTYLSEECWVKITQKTTTRLK